MSINTYLSLEENMMFQSCLYRIPKARAKQRMEKLICDFGPQGYRKYPVASYSGGIKRRLDIALNMMSDPRILFLDEPTVRMDIQSCMAMWDMMRKIRDDFDIIVLEEEKENILIVMKTRACLKIAFCKMCVPICGGFVPKTGGVVGYADCFRGKFPAKWGVQIAGMNFQTRSSESPFDFLDEIETALTDMQYLGKVIIDELLHSGNNDERFIVGYFNGKEFESGKFDFKIVAKRSGLREPVCRYLRKDKEFLHLTGLTGRQQKLIETGCVI